MAATNPRQSQEALLSESKVRDILSQETNAILQSGEQIVDVDVKPLKTYLDDKSYSVQALYEATIQDAQKQTRDMKIFASAHSSGNKYKDYQIGRYMYAWSKKYPLKTLLVPAVYGYIESRGLFLREYIEGERSKDIMRSKRKVNRKHAKLVNKGLIELHEIKLPSTIQGLDGRSNLDDLKNNLKILRSRSHDEFKQVAERYRDITKRLQDLSNAESETEVFCHGDFNPSNIIITENNQVSLIDFGSASLQHPLWDVAAFCSHLLGMEDLGMNPKQRTRAGKVFLRQYQSLNEPIEEQETELLNAYHDYFDLLAHTHKLVWG